VTNNTINIDQHNLSVIKEPSETLFAFKSASIGIEIQGIKPDARFLFASLAKLTFLAVYEKIETSLSEAILRTVKYFETVSFLHRELCVELKFEKTREWSNYFEQKAGERRVTLANQIGTAGERLDALDMTNMLELAIDDLFMMTDEDETGRFTDELVCWSRLTELNMYGCGSGTLDNPELFGKLFPHLRKLNLNWNPIKSLAEDVFKHAGKLLELEIDFSKNDDPISLITNKTFSGLVNLRMLDVKLKTLESLEPFNCLCNLEELAIHVDRESALKRLDAFPSQLSKLRVLKLQFCYKIEWISLTAFDHLKRLERFEFACFEYLGIQPLEISIAPRFLKFVGVEKLRLLGDESSVRNIETIEFLQSDFYESQSSIWSSGQVERLDCDIFLSGLERLSTMPLNEASLSYNKMLNLEVLNLNLADFGVLKRSGLGCLSKLKELTVDRDLNGEFELKL
jgi:hypothetical protein